MEKSWLLGGACVIAVLSTPGIAFAQTVDQDGVETVTVSSTRVNRDGYSAPTPTTVLGLSDIESQVAANIADVVNETPALAASTTSATGNASALSGTAGMNLFNLRSLGPNRTLVLLDGTRPMPSNPSLNVDINQLPTELVQRVDIVTGGASADWGSDAVAGVVNFVLDKKYDGFKGFLQAGESELGDGKNVQTALTYGTGFDGGRGHFEISGKYENQAAIAGPSVSGRDWYQGYKIIPNPNGSATDVLLPNVGLSNATAGGLITAGPLKGTQFVGSSGTPEPFNFGFVSGNESVNGSAEDYGGQVQIQNSLEEGNAFGRLSYDISNDITLYGEATYSKYGTGEQLVPFNRLGNLTISKTNAYLPQSIVNQMTAAGVTSFTFGTTNAALGWSEFHRDAEVMNFKVGLEGRLDRGWTWDSYYEHGQNNEHLRVDNDPIIANYNAAINAVSSGGSIVCASTVTNPTNGCVPYDPFGVNPATAAQRAYFIGQALENLRLIQDDFALNVQGTPFATWAGNVSVASGFEYRREGFNQQTDPLSQTNSLWQNLGTPASGSYNVAEGYVEAVVPLLSNVDFAKELDVNGALRATGYSASGVVETWKLGATWDLDEQFRLRGNWSTDIRAPNLQDLFATGIAGNQALNDAQTKSSYQVQTATVGSLALTPEVSRSVGGGLVYQPNPVPGLSLSVDYFGISIHDAINTPTAQNFSDLCYAGSAVACAQIVRGTNGLITKITVVPLNLQIETTSGFDLAATYRQALSTFDDELPGTLTLRAMATDTMDHTVNFLGTVVQFAGTNGDAQYADPRWRGLLTATYDLDAFSSTLTARFIGSGVISYRTPVILNNSVASTTYIDLSTAYTVKDGIQIYGGVQNLFDQAPPPTPQISAAIHFNMGVNDYIYDTVGRQFRLGVRFNF